MINSLSWVVTVLGESKTSVKSMVRLDASPPRPRGGNSKSTEILHQKTT
jgi:hypothetical protein